MTAIRQHLDEHQRAQRDIELTEVAINILERTSNSSAVIRTLRKKQYSYLKKLDAAAAKLGAPYIGAKEQ